MGLLGIEVLVVESEKWLQDIIKYVLHSSQRVNKLANYRLFFVENLELAQRSLHRADVILLDLNLPNSEGLETFQRIYQSASNENTPIIILADDDDFETASAAVRQGAAYYLLKDWILSNTILLHFFICFAIDRWRQRGKLADFQRERLGEFKGLIPACANCGKWRDETGGEWLEPAEYIERFSALRFTHGTCPVCMEDRYGDEIRGAMEEQK